VRKVINEVDRPAAELVEGFRSLLPRYSPSCIVSDVMERARTMHSALVPASPGRFVGPALTVKLYPGDLVDCLDALRVARAGDVIVVDAAAETETSIWGGLMAGLCLQKGVAGAVVDGAVRDVDEVRDLGFPLVSRSITPRSTHSPYSNRLEPIEIGVPIVCGGTLVEPGDIVLARAGRARGADAATDHRRQGRRRAARRVRTPVITGRTRGGKR
jgi:regulator of RNase E activity RraA